MAKLPIRKKITMNIDGVLGEDGIMEFEDLEPKNLLELLEEFIGDNITITITSNQK